LTRSALLAMDVGESSAKHCTLVMSASVVTSRSVLGLRRQIGCVVLKFESA
jgi:hypothetical protein